MEKRYLQFTSITSLNVVDEYLVLILTNSKNILIPLKAFNSLKEQENFFKLLEEKTHKKITTSYPKNYLFNILFPRHPTIISTAAASKVNIQKKYLFF